MDVVGMLQEMGFDNARERKSVPEQIRQRDAAIAERRAKIVSDKSTHGIPCRETIARFEQMCRQHDWYYMMSDDHNVYRMGKMQANALRGMMRQYPSLRPIYQSYVREAGV